MFFHLSVILYVYCFASKDFVLVLIYMQKIYDTCEIKSHNIYFYFLLALRDKLDGVLSWAF